MLLCNQARPGGPGVGPETLGLEFDSHVSVTFLSHICLVKIKLKLLVHSFIQSFIVSCIIVP